MQSKQLFSLLFMVFAGILAYSQGAFQENNMVRENSPLVIVDTLKTNGSAPYIILTNYKSEEILIVVTDLLGNEIFSKVVFKNQCAVLKAYDPYNKIPSGVYTVTATNRNEIYNQRVVID